MKDGGGLGGGEGEEEEEERPHEAFPLAIDTSKQASKRYFTLLTETLANILSALSFLPALRSPPTLWRHCVSGRNALAHRDLCR
jgi:hypothetical protein